MSILSDILSTANRATAPFNASTLSIAKKPTYDPYSPELLEKLNNKSAKAALTDLFKLSAEVEGTSLYIYAIDPRTGKRCQVMDIDNYTLDTLVERRTE